MPRCQACGSESPAGYRFCGSCGAPLGEACTRCGAPGAPEQRFCGRCGGPLTAPTNEAVATTPRPEAPSGERKLVTVLFADVVGFTAMAEDRDPEAVAAAVDGAFRRMAEVVEAHGGTVDKYMGDCVMALFGVPLAHSDDAERAVSAALAMRDLGQELRLSIGVNTGEVMVTGVGAGGDVTVIGDTVNVAARLEKAAGPGEVLVGPLTAELASSGIVFESRKAAVLQGRREPVSVFAAVAARGAAVHTAADGPPLAGRADELAVLRGCWRRVLRERRAEVVRVVGDAGLGKTRLVDELAAEVASEATVVRARYPAYGVPSGQRIAADVVAQLGPTGNAELDARLDAMVQGRPPAGEVQPATLQQEYAAALRRLLRLHALRRPLLVAVDDMHNAGDAALDMFSDVTAGVNEAPVLLLQVGRPDPPGWLTRQPSLTTVAVAPLAREESLALLEKLRGTAPPLPAETAVALVDRAGGNPLHLRELLRLEEMHAGVAAALPASLQSVLSARLDALPPAEKSALQHLSVFGDGARDEELAGLGLGTVDDPLRRLAAAGLVRSGDGGVHRIRDPLLREVAYEAMPRRLRGELHTRAAAVATTPEGAARHLDLAASCLPGDAGATARAIDALRDVGLHHLGTTRHVDGTRLLLRAVDLGLRDPETMLSLAQALVDMSRTDDALAVVERIPPGDERTEIERIHIRANATSVIAPAEALAGFAEARRRWAALGDRSKEGWALANSAMSHFYDGRVGDATAALEEAMVLFAASEDRHGLLAAEGLLGLLRPEDPRAGGWLERALEYSLEVGDRGRERNALSAMVWHELLRGRWGGTSELAAVRRHAGHLAAVAAELGDATNQARALALDAYAARLGGSFDELEALADRVRTTGIRDGSAESRLVQAVLLGAGAAAGSLEAVAAMPASLASDPVAGVAVALAAEALILAGRVAEVHEQLGTGVGRSAAPIEVIVGHPVTALALVLRGQPAEALPLIEMGTAVADAIGAVSCAAALRALHAEVYWCAGDARGARRALAEAGNPVPGGLGELVVLRVRAVVGEPGAVEEVAAAAAALRAPGLLAGVPGMAAPAEVAS